MSSTSAYSAYFSGSSSISASASASASEYASVSVSGTSASGTSASECDEKSSQSIHYDQHRPMSQNRSQRYITAIGGRDSQTNNTGYNADGSGMRSKSSIFDSTLPPILPPRAHPPPSLFDSTDPFYSQRSSDNLQNQYPDRNATKDVDTKKRWHRTNSSFETFTTPGLSFRSVESTQRAVDELRKKRRESMERRRAGALVALLCLLVLVAHRVATDVMDDSGNSSVGGKRSTGGNDFDVNSGMLQSNSANTIDGSNELTNGDEDEEEDEEFEPGFEYLEPLRHFANTDSPRRSSDTNFFFHVPRSGGQVVKNIAGQCFGLTLANEVGVRNGHGNDPRLGVYELNQAKYVNVDTTSIDGLHRAAELGLASSGFSHLVSSSYFIEAGLLFDSGTKGRATIMLRQPINRAVSMYQYRMSADNNAVGFDSTVTLIEYASGNGIENNWVTRFLTGKMEGELFKEDLEQALEILRRKFIIGFLDDIVESMYRFVKYNDWEEMAVGSTNTTLDKNDLDNRQDCIESVFSNENRLDDPDRIPVPVKGSREFGLLNWQNQFDIKLYIYAKDLFDTQTKQWGSKERRKELKKLKKKGGN